MLRSGDSAWRCARAAALEDGDDPSDSTEMNMGAVVACCIIAAGALLWFVGGVALLFGSALYMQNKTMAEGWYRDLAVSLDSSVGELRLALADLCGTPAVSLRICESMKLDYECPQLQSHLKSCLWLHSSYLH